MVKDKGDNTHPREQDIGSMRTSRRSTTCVQSGDESIAVQFWQAKVENEVSALIVSLRSEHKGRLKTDNVLCERATKRTTSRRVKATVRPPVWTASKEDEDDFAKEEGK